jgi:hypothetical protein
MNALAIAGTALAGVMAWLAWTYAPAVLARVGLEDLELLGRLACVVLTLSVLERVFAAVARRFATPP